MKQPKGIVPSILHGKCLVAAVDLLLLSCSLGKGSSMSEIAAADLLQHFPLVSCLGEGRGVKDTSVQSCPSLPSILGNEGFTWVNLFHIKNSSAICIPVYFCILCYYFLHSHIARVNVYMSSVRAGGEQTLGARSCTSSLCLHPSVGPPMCRAPPASRCGRSSPSIGFGRHGHVFSPAAE